MVSQMALAALALALVGTTSAQTTIGGLSGSHTDIPRWCGKPYMAGSPNFNPGGMLYPPKPSATPMLDLQVQPRYSIYDSSETTGEFVVDTSLSLIKGQRFSNVTPSNAGGGVASSFAMLEFDIRIESTNELLVSNSAAVNTTGNLFEFDLTTLKPKITPYSIVLDGALTSFYANQSYTATTELYYLPVKNNGSTVKVDNVDGGMLVANNATNYEFIPILPFGFYTSCSGYLNYSLANVSAYKDLGFNAINPVCAFTDGPLDYLFDWMDETNLWYQYDMRSSYLNLTEVAEQIPLVKDRSNLLNYYTADEPDGWQYALNSTRLAYDLLKKEDPYHPTALVLNCDNYYFGQYSAGADVIMEDAYPVGINATYSRPYNTTCNETYGDCGCDDCIGSLNDVSHRLDTLIDYQTWLNIPQKPLWAVLQAFSGEGYWSRDPTVQETWVMMLLSFNHGAKGVMSWTFPASPSLEQAHGEMAKVATAATVADFLLGTQPERVELKDEQLLDVSYWKLEHQVLVGVANLDYAGSDGTTAIALPFSSCSIVGQAWGNVSWSLDDRKLVAKKLAGLATSFVILDI